ncbi:MAG: hypothetical protein SangKO_012180 [Sandaracinaceae bacterium]
MAEPSASYTLRPVAETPQDPASDGGGLTLGPYRLVKRLAVGGMAEIFLARREGPEGFARELVVKRILPHLCADEEFVQMFLDEARLAAKLHHPNVVHVYDFGHADESYYLAMELVRGVDLRALVDRAAALSERGGAQFGAPTRGMPPHHAAKIVSFVCEGLAHAHALPLDDGNEGVVHRDVTPSNVLISFDGAVKLADFGIAKAQEGLDRRDPTGHGVVKGKYAYLSPEQARGEPLDARSDLFNVGILLFECLLGEPLFPQHDLHAAKRLAARGEVPELQRLSRVPPPLARVVRRALSARRADRYESALSLRAELEAFLRAHPEPSDAVELGRYARALFPDVIADDKPRAAGTVPATAPVTAVLTPVTPPGSLPPGSRPPSSGSRRGSSSARPHARGRPRGSARALVALAIGSVLLGAGAATGWFLWQTGSGQPPAAPSAPPRDPALTPPPAATPRGQLRVSTDPPGAEVRVDGVVVGLSPLVHEVDAERAHVVEVSAADDSVSGRREVVLAADEIREVRFEGGAPPRGRLRVLSSPGGATVRIDGALAGTTPLEAYVAPGRHEVRASLDGFEDAEDEVELSGPEETAVLSFALTAEPRDRAPPERPRGAGVLMISTTPWSEVYLGGRHLGTTPLANVRLPAGRHVLSLRHPGRPARRHPVSIRAGRTTRVRLAL